MSLGGAIHDALQIPAPQPSQEKVHQLVARRLDELSPGSKIQLTGYFNHSWVPDLVVKWRDTPDRPVFLRFDVKHPSFGDDLEYLSDERPFFLDIAGEGPESERTESPTAFDVSEALRAEGRDQVLVSEVDAIDDLGGRVEADRDATAATRQVVVGGRGLVDSSVAEEIVDAWSTASSAAAEARSEVLRDALNTVERFLSRNASLDLEAELRTTWVSSGHEAEAFPGSEEWELRDRGPHEIAELVAALVERGGQVQAEQWDEIAKAISATALGSELAHMGRAETGGMVNDLVRAGLRYWTARYAYVPELDAETLTDTFDWSYGKYALALNLIRRKAYFTDIGVKWSRVPRPESLPDARGRLDKLDDPNVLGAGIVTPEENVSHELRSTATTSLAERLQPFIEQDPTWRSARLRWLELRVPGSEAVAHVDFSRNVVRVTDSIPLSVFALLVGEFVAALTAEELTQLQAVLTGQP